MRNWLRKALGLETCGSLLLAFALAPFQHVHTHDGHGTEVHAHFYALWTAYGHARIEADHDARGAHFDDVDDHASAKVLDTFVLQLPPALAPFVLAQTQDVEPMLTPASVPCAAAEPCAHDPPGASLSIPRAPPY